ncbi:MAG: SCO1664 family protein [Caldilineaceae bacterium]
MELSSESEAVQVSEKEVLATLLRGKMQERGLLPYSSNHSFLVTVSDEERTIPAVYKPQRGETPLYDFEWGTLCQRETAAFLISSALEWGLVPPTVLRNGKHGIGSVQFYIDHDPNIHYFNIHDDARFAETLRRLSLFDYICNNADRKSGHCLIGNDGQLWAIDHGICFHTDYKLRTVIWEFAGQPIPERLLQDMHKLQCDFEDQRSVIAQGVCRLLNESEREKMNERLEQLLKQKQFPAPHPQRRNYPWPPV